MSNYLVRVELHGATADDYEKLHLAMKAAGFRRTISSDDGVLYQLPSGEYSIDSPNTASQVRDSAKVAADSTGRTSWVLAVQWAKAAWTLPKAPS